MAKKNPLEIDAKNLVKKPHITKKNIVLKELCDLIDVLIVLHD